MNFINKDYLKYFKASNNKLPKFKELDAIIVILGVDYDF